ncbi:MAG: HD domain-containing protein [Anaerolineae bacterium]
MTDQNTLNELDRLVRETCLLWAPGWVAYNWRNYTYDHIQRVRGLAVTLTRLEGGDLMVSELAALLHDITKPYDGDYLTDDQGKRLVDAEGFWISATRQPEGENEITRLYASLGLAGKVHNRSGAILAGQILAARGYSSEVGERAAQAIAEHLGPKPDAPCEALCLYDADLVDANIGLPAFIRHIYIHQHFYDQRRAANQPALADILVNEPRTYLEPYIREALPRWVEGKARDFPPQLRTKAGREIALARLSRIQAVSNRLIDELKEWDSLSVTGGAAVILYLLQRPEEPSIAAEIRALSDGWAGERVLSQDTRQSIADLAAEAAGLM